MSDLLFYIISFNRRVITGCFLVLHQNLAFSALLMPTSFPAHLFTMLFKLLWGRDRFIIEASAILNLA